MYILLEINENQSNPRSILNNCKTFTPIQMSDSTQVLCNTIHTCVMAGKGLAENYRIFQAVPIKLELDVRVVQDIKCEHPTSSTNIVPIEYEKPR